MKRQTAEDTFQEYKQNTKRYVDIYNHTKTKYPLHSFPKVAKMVWQYGMLSEIWGIIATKLSPTGRNYLKEWREGGK